MKALQPLTHGSILIVGAKASNFDDDINRNPRVAVWDSQNEHWLGKELPVNTRAIFCTRWMGHDAFTNIMKEARKKRITIFTPQGTGMIAKQVKELLNMNGTKEMPITTVKYVSPVVAKANELLTTPLDTQSVEHTRIRGKLIPLRDYIDYEKNSPENGRILFEKAKELKIPTTLRSVTNMVNNEMKKRGRLPVLTLEKEKKEFPKYKNDVAVEIFDNILKELKDLREYLIQTTLENRALRTRIEKFKNILEVD